MQNVEYSIFHILSNTLLGFANTRLDTKLESDAAEFLVLGRLLLERAPTYKSYVNYPGYDHVTVNPDKNTVAPRVFFPVDRGFRLLDEGDMGAYWKSGAFDGSHLLFEPGNGAIEPPLIRRARYVCVKCRIGAVIALL
jgi:hypothetical protein